MWPPDQWIKPKIFQSQDTRTDLFQYSRERKPLIFIRKRNSEFQGLNISFLNSVKTFTIVVCFNEDKREGKCFNSCCSMLGK